MRGFSNIIVTSSVGVVVSCSPNKMATNDTSDILSEGAASLSSVDSESEGDYGIVDLHAN